MKYHYHVEDGQFSFDAELNKLLGEEGQVIQLPIYGDRESMRRAYILYIDGTHVECIGQVDRGFPSTPEEHNFWKEEMKRGYASFNNPSRY